MNEQQNKESFDIPLNPFFYKLDHSRHAILIAASIAVSLLASLLYGSYNHEVTEFLVNALTFSGLLIYAMGRYTLTHAKIKEKNAITINSKEIVFPKEVLMELNLDKMNAHQEGLKLTKDNVEAIEIIKEKTKNGKVATGAVFKTKEQEVIKIGFGQLEFEKLLRGLNYFGYGDYLKEVDSKLFKSIQLILIALMLGFFAYMTINFYTLY